MISEAKHTIELIQKGLAAADTYIKLVENRANQTSHSSVQVVRTQELYHAKNVYSYFNKVTTTLHECMHTLDALNDNRVISKKHNSAAKMEVNHNSPSLSKDSTESSMMSSSIEAAAATKPARRFSIGTFLMPTRTSP